MITYCEFYFYDVKEQIQLLFLLLQIRKIAMRKANKMR